MDSLSQQLFGAHQEPAFERRGLMLDISRNRVPTMDCLKQLIDAMALLRYNELQLYTEHTFAYAKHTTVWADASPMTAGEIRELDHYCRARGIELVPNQNSFGHMERWLRHDAYRHFAECPNGFEHPISGWRKYGSTLYPSPESLAFISGLYSELLPNFTSKQLHIGGDEPWEIGQGRSHERVEREGKHAVYLDFLKQLLSVANKQGHRAQFWADIVLERPELVAELPADICPVIWGYDADSPFPEQCRIVADAGFRDSYYVAPGAGNWNSFGGRLDVARANIARAAQAGRQHGARGLLLTAWGDNGHHQPWPTLFAPLILAACAGWGVEPDLEQLPNWIDALFYPNQAAGNGAALCQLGKIDALLPQPLPPTSFLHAAFFADLEGLETLRALTTTEQLRQTQIALTQIDTTALDPEITLGIDLNQAAIQRCLDTPKNQEALDELYQRFETLWLKRSRPGGLAESLQRLKVNH